MNARNRTRVPLGNRPRRAWSWQLLVHLKMRILPYLVAAAGIMLAIDIALMFAVISRPIAP